jgi:hypothetical protein
LNTVFRKGVPREKDIADGILLCLAVSLRKLYPNTTTTNYTNTTGSVANKIEHTNARTYPNNVYRVRR